MRLQRIVAAFIVGPADLPHRSPLTARAKRRYLARRGLDLAQACELMEDRAGCQVRRHKG